MVFGRYFLLLVCINSIYFRLLGLCNNFGYVVMLSAAHDILKQEEPPSNSTEPVVHNTTNRLDCNRVSTGVSRSDNLKNLIIRIIFQAILLADIIPALIIKVAAPFFMHHIVYK